MCYAAHLHAVEVSGGLGSQLRFDPKGHILLHQGIVTPSMCYKILDQLCPVVLPVL